MSMEDDAGQIGRYADNGGPEAKLSALSGAGRAVVAQGGSGSVKISARPPALVGVRIPSRSENVRQLVVRVYEENLHLHRADLWAVTRYAELSWKFRRLSELIDRMEDGNGAGYLRKDMEPRRVLSELRALSGELLRHEGALGITAAARAAMGVDIAKGQGFAERVQRARERR